jgi:hypothetical protein
MDAKTFYKELKLNKPTVYEAFTNSHGQVVVLVEHPWKGDEYPVIAMFPELQMAFKTEFFDTEDMLAEHKEYEPYFYNGKIKYGAGKIETSDEEFLGYIIKTLIPDLREGGHDFIADDIFRLYEMVSKLM